MICLLTEGLPALRFQLVAQAAHLLDGVVDFGGFGRDVELVMLELVDQLPQDRSHLALYLPDLGGEPR